MMKQFLLIGIITATLFGCSNNKKNVSEGPTEISSFGLRQLPDSLLGTGCTFAENADDFKKSKLLVSIVAVPMHKKLILFLNKKLAMLSEVAFDTNATLKINETIVKYSDGTYTAFMHIFTNEQIGTEADASEGNLTLICPDGTIVKKQLYGACAN